MKSKNLPYMPSLDHLRAFAAILIIFYHGFYIISYKQLYGGALQLDHWIYTNNPLKALVLEGHTAVALFMVLSGFIFTYGAMGHKIKYFNFMKNRLLRIYPLFILLIVTGIYTYPDKFSFVSLLQTIFCLDNLPGALPLNSLSAMFWAIGVEFQFYIIFPFLLNFLENYKIKKFINIILVAIIFRIISYLLNSNIRDVSYYTILGRIDQFAIGMIIAQIYSNFRKNELYEKYFKILLIPSIILILSSLFIFNKLGGWIEISFWKLFWPTFEGGIWGFFILCYIFVFNSSKNLMSSLLSKIGEASFSIYLIQSIILQIINDKNWIVLFSQNAYRDAILNTLIIILPIVLGISFITYNVIEKPFLELRTKYLE